MLGGWPNADLERRFQQLLKPSAFQSWDYQPRELSPILSKTIHDLKSLFNEMYRQEQDLERIRIESAGESYLLSATVPQGESQMKVEEIYREVVN